MNYTEEEILTEINNRLSNSNMTIGARWLHKMTIEFWIPIDFIPPQQQPIFRVIPRNLIIDLFNRQVNNATKLNAAYDDLDAPVDWPMVLLTPNQMRTIQNEEPVTTYNRYWEFTYRHSVDLFELNYPERPMNDLLQWGLDSLDRLFSERDLERLRSSWRGRMASLAARACRLILPPVETMVNRSAFKLTNNNCLSRNWWLTKFNERLGLGLGFNIPITVQNNRTIDLRRDEQNYVNLKY